MTAALEQLRERFPRVAVVHDWLTIPGGSEDVVIELLKMFPNAELFTSIYDPAPWPVLITERRVHPSPLDKIPGASRNYQKLLPLMTAAFRSFDFSRFDLVLSSSHACAKNIRTPPSALHICYCHTPMRYAWDESLLEGEEIGRVTRLALPLMLSRLRRQDVQGATSPDLFVANSENVADRIRRYYGRTAEIVNPPVMSRVCCRSHARPAITTSSSDGSCPTSASSSRWPHALASEGRCKSPEMDGRWRRSGPPLPDMRESSCSGVSATLRVTR